MAFASFSAGSQNVNQLLQRAEQFCDTSSYDHVSELYRNKPASYFEEVKQNNDVMTPILKDQGGDPLCPINGKLSGVFFGVTLIKGSLPTISPFGDTRIHIPIQGLFDYTTNLYFADFFCVGTRNHFVLLVLTKSGSDADKFCKDNLPKLDPATNKFLRRSSSNFSEASYTTISRSHLFVEVFYTDSVDIKVLRERFGLGNVHISPTATHGKGHSTLGGLRKKGSCKVCNVRFGPLQADWCNVYYDSSDSSSDGFDDYGYSDPYDSDPWY